MVTNTFPIYIWDPCVLSLSIWVSSWIIDPICVVSICLSHMILVFCALSILFQSYHTLGPRSYYCNIPYFFRDFSNVYFLLSLYPFLMSLIFCLVCGCLRVIFLLIINLYCVGSYIYPLHVVPAVIYLYIHKLFSWEIRVLPLPLKFPTDILVDPSAHFFQDILLNKTFLNHLLSQLRGHYCLPKKLLRSRKITLCYWHRYLCLKCWFPHYSASLINNYIPMSWPFHVPVIWFLLNPITSKIRILIDLDTLYLYMLQQCYFLLHTFELLT